MSDSPRPAQVDHRVFEKAYEERQALRDKWPMLPPGILGNELYAQHCSILGGEPDFEEMCDVVEQVTYCIRKDGEFKIEDIDVCPYYSGQHVQSYLWFAEMCCFVRCIGKGKYTLLYDEAKKHGVSGFSWPKNLERHAQDVIDDICQEIEQDEQDETDKEEDQVHADAQKYREQRDRDLRAADKGPAPMFVVRDDVI